MSNCDVVDASYSFLLFQIAPLGTLSSQHYVGGGSPGVCGRVVHFLIFTSCFGNACRCVPRSWKRVMMSEDLLRRSTRWQRTTRVPQKAERSLIHLATEASRSYSKSAPAASSRDGMRVSPTRVSQTRENHEMQADQLVVLTACRIAFLCFQVSARDGERYRDRLSRSLKSCMFYAVAAAMAWLSCGCR